MITKKTMFSLLILSFIWQGTSLYGMYLVARQSTRPLSGKLLNTFTKRYHCGSSAKGPDYLKKKIRDLERDLEGAKKTITTLHKNIRYCEERLNTSEKIIRSILEDEMPQWSKFKGKTYWKFE